MTADVRGEEYEAVPAGAPVPEPWTLSCGHLRERMDPVFRLLWWRAHHPEVMAQARYFLGWHDFLTLRLTGRAVVDRSSASRYLVYDLESNDWVAERAAEYGIELDLLPEVLPWGEVIGEITPAVADEVGLPPGVRLAVGCYDALTSSLGAGIAYTGTSALTSGSFENVVVPTDLLPTPEMLLYGLSFMPHPGKAERAAIAFSATGCAVMNWARRLVGVSLEGLEERLAAGGPGPSHVMAVPYLSGSMLYWEGGRQAKGALVGLTLATTDLDVVQALMESIAYEHINTLAILADEGITVDGIRAVGGGAKSAWWTQLKADMLGTPIEVVDQPEPGTLGAALLAGQAVGLFDDVAAQSERFTRVIRRHEPDAARAGLHRERLADYRRLVPTLIDTVYAG
jgi:xylulokinase